MHVGHGVDVRPMKPEMVQRRGPIPFAWAWKMRPFGCTASDRTLVEAIIELMRHHGAKPATAAKIRAAGRRSTLSLTPTQGFAGAP